MKKNLATWIITALAGMILVLLLNTSPLARLGFAIDLPGGWHNGADPAGYKDKACSRHTEGIPFAFKRPSAVQSCTFDTNKSALVFNGLTGLVLGLGYAFVSTKWYKKDPRHSTS
jgi:hypothetical protein